MSGCFSSRSRCRTEVFCDAPVLTVGFPKTCPCPGPDTVVLANGAVVDLRVLGQIVSQFCPAFARPFPAVTAATLPATVVQVAGPTQLGVTGLGTIDTTALAGGTVGIGGALAAGGLVTTDGTVATGAPVTY